VAVASHYGTDVEANGENLYETLLYLDEKKPTNWRQTEQNGANVWPKTFTRIRV